jgi:predicted lipoprotein with Yx(FWY)xxD motif
MELEMKRKITVFIVTAVFAAALVAAALGETSSASSAAASHGARVALRKTALGRVLVDARGRTLYVFEKDTHGRSACYRACAAYWPPLLSDVRPWQGNGVRASLLGVARRKDGKRQVTYAGHPLYTYVGDTKAGMTTGEGLTDFGGSWDAVAANGRSVESTSSDSDGSDGGYGGYGSGG